MSLARRLDEFQRRHPVLGVPVAVLYKFLDDQGVYLAAIITLYGFFSIFPLFLLLSSVLGFMLENDPALQSEVLRSAASQIPVIGDQIERRTLTGSVTAVTIGAIVALWGALGVATAVQNAMNVVWNVPRNLRPDPVKLRLRSARLLVILGLFFVGTTLLSQVGAVLAAYADRVSWGGEVYATAGSLVLSTIILVVLGHQATAADIAFRSFLPGAVVASVCWQLLQDAGQTFVRTYIASAGALEGVFAIVLGLLVWLYVSSIVMIWCLELNVVLARRLYPRALYGGMTETVDLTPADQQAYASLARTQSIKGFQNIEVSFEHDGQNATALAAARHRAHLRRDRLRRREQEVAAQPVAPPAGGVAGGGDRRADGRSDGSDDADTLTPQA